MVRIQNPPDLTRVLERGYPDTILATRGYSWFDDFDRKELNPANAVYDYTEIEQDPEITLSTDSGKQFAMGSASQSGVARYGHAEMSTYIARRATYGSPYYPVKGVLLSVRGALMATSAGFARFGFCTPVPDPQEDLADRVAINISTNIDQAQTVSADGAFGNATDNEAILEAAANVRIDADITWEFGARPEITVVNETTGARETHTLTIDYNSFDPQTFFVDSSITAYGQGALLRAWGVQYF